MFMEQEVAREMLCVLRAPALQGSCGGCVLEEHQGGSVGVSLLFHSHKAAWSHLWHLAMGSGQSDSTAVHPTPPEQMFLKAQFSLF